MQKSSLSDNEFQNVLDGVENMSNTDLQEFSRRFLQNFKSGHPETLQDARDFILNLKDPKPKEESKNG